MEKISIGDAMSAGWRSFETRQWFLFGVTLGFIGLFVLTGAAKPWVTALAYILYGGYIALLIRHYRGDHVSFDDLFITDQRWIHFAFLTVIKGVLLFLAFLCFIIPGIYLSVRWMFAELYVIDEGKRPVEALRASYALTEGYWWHLFLFLLLVVLLFFVGVIAFVVGAAVVAAVTTIASIKLFDDLRGIQWRAHHPE